MIPVTRRRVPTFAVVAWAAPGPSTAVSARRPTSTVAASSDNALTVDLAASGQVIAPVGGDGARPGEKVTLGLRPEHLLEGGGGDVEIVPSENADTLAAFIDGAIAGAWVPEPWATRLVNEGDGHVLVD